LAKVSRPVSGSWKLVITSRSIGLAIRNTRIAIMISQRIMLGSARRKRRGCGRGRDVIECGGH
jgi:hypothetical protein